VQKGRARSASPCGGWDLHALVVGRHLQNRVAAGAYHLSPEALKGQRLGAVGSTATGTGVESPIRAHSDQTLPAGVLPAA